MKKIIVILIAIAVLVLFFLIEIVYSVENPGLSLRFKDEPLVFGDHLAASIAEMAPVYKIARAIATCEGFYAGNTRASRNRNPGNVKLKGGPHDSLGLTVFDNKVEGWLWLYKLLTTRYRGMSPLEMNRAGYATDQNWHTCVSSVLKRSE